MLPGSTPPDSVQPAKPRQAAPINRSCDAPIVGANGKPSRAARREANRVARAVAEMEAFAHAAAPAVSLDEKRPAPSLSGVSLLPTGQEHDLRSKEQRSSITGVGALPAGRPSSYTDDEADVLCAWVQGGGSLRAYSKETGRSVQTVYRWMRENAGFQTRYSQAHEDRADTLTDEMLEIADAAALTPTIEGVAAAKLQLEARKWIATKLRPQRWGDKQVVEHVGAVSIRIGIPAKPQLTAPPSIDMVERVS